MADMRTWSHEFITEFIELYRSLPCLYDVKNKQYLNKPLKLAAYNKMVEKIKTVDPAATKDVVVKKINNMRSSYRKELKKIKDSQRSGSSGEVYETSLWYFHLLDFLYDHETPRKSKSNMEDMEMNNSDDSEEEAQENAQSPASNELERDENVSQDKGGQCNESSENILSTSTSSVSSTRKRTSIRSSKKQKTNEPDQQQAVLKLVAEKLQNEKKYSNYATYVGQELDALPPMMATYCQKIINDALFNAKCGQLTAHSRIVTYSQTSSTSVQYPEQYPQQYPQQFNTMTTDYDNQPSTCQPPTTRGYYNSFEP